jgi:DNA-binding CsgD family transcriptional regulator
VLPRLRALTAPDSEAEAFFEAATFDPERPFENARTQLLHGEFLRRARHRVRARPLLESAGRTFADLGATPWSDRAAAELTATAERARRRDGDGSARLTAHELAIARLVADGASNQRVAEQLSLSRKTVESHLHKVYTKLGIGSRKQLRDALPDD